MKKLDQAVKLLEEVRYALNMIPNQRNIGMNGESSYDIAAKVDRFFTGDQPVEETVKPVRERYVFGSSHGDVVTDLEGNVIPEESSLDDYLLEIRKVDIVEFKKWLATTDIDPGCRHFDILDVGFWTLTGEYDKPEYGHRELSERN